jgi:hypothetical protein
MSDSKMDTNQTDPCGGPNSRGKVFSFCLQVTAGYTEIDWLVLERQRIIIISDSKRFLEVRDSTIVVSIATDIPVRQIVSDLARPAMLVWNRIRHDNSIEHMHVFRTLSKGY